MDRVRVLVLFGGRSGEHEVSVQSGRTVVSALEALGHEAVTVGISRGGRWIRWDPRASDRVPEEGVPYALAPEPDRADDIDVVFPALHGPYVEDGCLQGLLELAGVAYVGAGVEGSAIAMNKAIHKRLFAQAGLPIVEFVSFTAADWTADRADAIDRMATLGFPCFLKPARLGSSVGISKVVDREGLVPAAERALVHDDLVVAEACGHPGELEVGVLDGDPPEVSVAGQVVPGGEFYDYREKYRDGSTQLLVPADIPEGVAAQLRAYALRAFEVAQCEGLARVDFFWDPPTGRLLVNEINSIPGMTPTSMFPRVWEASGRPFPAVVERLLDHALRRHADRLKLERARAAAHEAEIGARADQR